jgi:hypothetical protein
MLVALSLPDISGCNIETFEQVFMIIIITPFIFTDPEGVPHSKRTGAVGVLTTMLA